MKSISYLILLIYILIREVCTYRVLGIFPLPYRSHNIFLEAIMKGLAREGNQVDVITHYELTNPPINYKTILNLAKLDFPFPESNFNTIQDAIDVVKDPLPFFTEVLGIHVCTLLSHKRIQDFIQNPPKDPPYDVIILEGWILSCFSALGQVFNVPVVTATPSLEFPWISRQIGNPLSTAIYPNFLIFKAEVKTFWDRLQNTVQSHIALQRFFFATEKSQTEIIRKFLSPDLPNIREIERSVALSLVNTHYTLQGIRPTIPAFIEVAGLHIEEDESNFTMELQRWMDESKHGVVYISFGTIVPIESLPRETILGMYNLFSKIAPTRVLIKAKKGKKLPPGLPKNVKTLTWIPQIPILRHNNTRVFITHGGIHSVQEAMHFGIPIIGVPLFYDQYQNIEILVNKKMGVQLNHKTITEKSLDEALRKILKNPKYREAAKYHSKLFRDRPMSPLKTATYWIEYVTRNGPQSLRSPALDLYWWQLENLDVYGLLLFCLAIVFYVISLIAKVIFKLFFRNNVNIQLKRD